MSDIVFDGMIFDRLREIGDQSDRIASLEAENERLRLTADEREAVATADAYMSAAGCHNTNVQKTLRGLLERTNHGAVPEAKAGASASSVPLGKAQASSESAPHGPSASQFSQPADAQGTGNTLTLTDEERAAIEGAADLLIGSKPGATLRKLLERLK